MANRIINLTPHSLSFMEGENNVILSVPSSGIARASQTRERTGTLEIGGVSIPINTCSYGQVTGLPEPVDGTIYVVSALTAQAVPDRQDVFIVDDAVRDETGRIIGCRALAHI